jgi:hypothetical protein
MSTFRPDLKLWGIALVCIGLAFIVSLSEPELPPKVGYILVENYVPWKESSLIQFSIDQLRLDKDKQRWYIRTDDGRIYYTTSR